MTGFNSPQIQKRILNLRYFYRLILEMSYKRVVFIQMIQKIFILKKIIDKLYRKSKVLRDELEQERNLPTGSQQKTDQKVYSRLQSHGCAHVCHRSQEQNFHCPCILSPVFADKSSVDQNVYSLLSLKKTIQKTN